MGIVDAGYAVAVFTLVDRNGAAVVQHYPVAHFQLTYGGADIFTSADPVRMVLPSDLTLRVVLTRASATGLAHGFFGISGHIE